MGNSQKKSTNNFTVSLSVRNFAVLKLPQKPQSVAQRIDERTWIEFINKCNDAGHFQDANERKSEYKKWKCYMVIGMVTFILGIFLAVGLGVSGGVTANAGLWVSAIVFGGGGFIGGMVLFFMATNKYGEIAKTFIGDVKAKLRMNLMELNTKYNGMIRFEVKDLGILKNFGSSAENADSAFRIGIEIMVLVQNVAYIEDQPQQPLVMSQAQNQQGQGQGQVIMVKLPNGQLVPAQIQAQNVLGYAPPKVESLQQMPPYNPNAQMMEEQQQEGNEGQPNVIYGAVEPNRNNQTYG